MSFKEIDPQKTLPQLEEEILDFWDKENIFQKSIDSKSEDKNFSFYDGPPFATGTPHYGHILQSITKDVVPRYWTMKGYKVPRKWGWDCHGLPIENIVEKELGYTHKKEILDLGVAKFNDICRTKVMEYATVWETVIRRMGRWADMKNAYKTMDLDYMESVWWVFKELWDKGLVYEGYRSMHICPRCETTLSQSEVTEGYKDIKDLSVIAEFELVDEPGTFILAWTTTPWTLLGNVALAVNEDIDYVKVKKNKGENAGKVYILSEAYFPKVISMPDEGNDSYELLSKIKGKDLVGKKYKPLFNYATQNENLKNHENGWKIYSAPFVTTEEGTGVVHIAPAFGEDDLNLSKENNLPFVQHIGMDGIIKEGFGAFTGLSVKPIGDVQSTDVAVIKYLAEKELLFYKAQYEHSYPHCWRCDTPLLNYATSSWFVKITDFKSEAIELAKEINWVPSHIKEGRFGKWLEGARDWSISRQRFWASVIPLWRCECGEIKVIGSIKELEDLSGEKITDLHKDKIDPITIPCAKCGGQMHRIPDVLDTWFDSGSMPFAGIHYPFENVENFEQTFPADFIGEAQDQTRAWFYYLHILSVALKQKIAFKNVVVSGIILAEDGKKMAKKLKNYPDPMLMFERYGADAVRLYILNSAVMQAENLNFSEKDLSEFSKGFFRMLWNSYSFFVLYANIDNFKPLENYESKNILDLWILSELNQLIKDTDTQMQKYELTKAARSFVPFVDNLSNWYIRRSRKRFQKQGDLKDKNDAYQTLYTVLTELSKVLAPFAPFISEEIFKNLTGKESVHLEDFPKVDESKINNELNQKMQTARKIVELGLALRQTEKIKVRQPLSKLTYTGAKIDEEMENIIADEVNVKEVANVKSNDKNISVDLDFKLTPGLIEEGIMNDLIRQIQDLRKKENLNPGQKAEVLYHADSVNKKIIENKKEEIMSATNLSTLTESENNEGKQTDFEIKK